VTADDTLIDLTGSGKDEADWGDRPQTKVKNIMSYKEGFGPFDLDQAIMEIVFLGSDANNDTATWTLYAWRDNGPCELLLDGTLALGQMKAETDPSSGQAALTSNLYADTIAVSNSYASMPYEIVDSGSDRIAKLRVPVLGRMFWCLLFTDTTGAGEVITAKALYSCYVGGGDIPLSPDNDIGDVHLLNVANTKINPATEDKQDDIIADTAAMVTDLAAIETLITAGNADLAGAQPNAVGLDEVGQDAKATTGYTTPNRVCHTLLVSCEDNGAVIAVDGSPDTENLFVNANYQETFTGLAITAATEIYAKNLVAGSNFTNLRLVAW